MSIEYINNHTFSNKVSKPKGPGLPIPNSKSAIPYTQSNVDYLRSLIGNWDYPFAIKEKLEQVSDQFKRPLFSFLLALDAYYESKTYIIEPKVVLYRSITEGPKYTKYLKELRYYSFIKTIKGVPEEDPEIVDMELYDISDVGQIFNYRYLFNWVEDINDYREYAYIPSTYKPLSDLYDFFLRDLPEKVIEFKKEEVLFKTSSSKTLYKGESLINFTLNSKNTINSFSKSIGNTKLVKIQKSAGDPREIVIMELDSLHTNNYIEYQVKEILKHYKENAMVQSKTTFEEKLKKFSYTDVDTVFYSRDLKKEGWTKPRELLTLLLMAIKEKYGWDIPTDYFEDFLVNGEKPPRGHGLGTANALTTLLYILLFRYCLLGESDIFEEFELLDLKALILNDDFVCKGDFASIEEYKTREFLLLNHLGLIINSKKSYTSRYGFSFAEQYFVEGQLLPKTSYEIYWTYLPLLGYNIRHAKVLSVSLEPNIENINTYKEWFGYEFFPEEYLYPYNFGGWFSQRVGKVDIGLSFLEKTKYSKIVSKAYLALETVEIPLNLFLKKRLKNKKHLFPKFLENLELSDDEAKLLGIPTLKTVLKGFSKLPEYLMEAFWTKYATKIKRRFNKVDSLSFEDLNKLYLSQQKNSIPSLNFYLERDLPPGCTFARPEYEFATPHLDFLAFIKKDIPNVKGTVPTPFGLQVSTDSRSKILSSSTRSRILFFNEVVLTPKIMGALPDWFLTSYEDPISVAKYMLTVTNGKLLYVDSLINKYPENILVYRITSLFPETRDNFFLFSLAYLYFEKYSLGRVELISNLLEVVPEREENLSETTEPETKAENPFELAENNLLELNEFEIPSSTNNQQVENQEDYSSWVEADEESVLLAPPIVRSLFFRHSSNRREFAKALGLPEEWANQYPEESMISYAPIEETQDIEEGENIETEEDLWSSLGDYT